MQATRSIQITELMLNTDPPVCTCNNIFNCRFLESSLISGQGLVSVGVASDAAQEEVTRIHRENVQRLAGFSEEEILKEKERIQQTIGMLHVQRVHVQCTSCTCTMCIVHVHEHKCKVNVPTCLAQYHIQYGAQGA